MLNLSLLVCTKNSAKNIMSCLNSSLPTLKAGAELILVDGRSTDNTVKLVLEFLSLHDITSYQLISQLSNGLYEAFNLAVEHSNRKKILFLHSDDILKNSHIVIQDVRRSSADVIFYGIEIEGSFLRRKWHIENLSSINVKSMLIPPHAGILVCRNIYCKIGKFRTDYKIAADFDWMMRLLCTSNI
ncbi:glycosyltransferase, partial [Alphaproteobacteria bacterium]|nr:glycosyltransferase [Alphaproteobacteria bacterium]